MAKLSEDQLQKIWFLSDTVLYPEAVAFIRRLVNDEQCSPLPTSQVKGLENIAESYKYDKLYHFVTHQRDRDWPVSKQSIKTLYTNLEKDFTIMKNRRLKDEFHLVSEGLNTQEARDEINALMAALAHEFIQHMVAENGLLDVAEREKRAREQSNRR
ncbi:MAG TPA: hypothetical protein VNG51_22300 [Ktedonobacteraceae bacterium]|nr:hypothetical protein [Ktedonobacteraceae bacterium]